MNCEYIVLCAEKTSQIYSRDPFSAASVEGAIVRFKDLGSLKGIYLCSTPSPAIVINNYIDEHMQKIVCAHELGHFILHKDMRFSCENINFESKSTIGTLEREANIFAAFFLLDKNEVLGYLKEGYSVKETASILNTDASLVYFTLSTLGLCNAPDSAFLK